MTSNRLRIACVFVCASLLTLLPSAVWAQALGPADFAFAIEWFDPTSQQWVQQNATEQQYFFSRARCECADPQGDGSGSDYSGYFRVVIRPSLGTPAKIQSLLAANLTPQGSGRLYAGAHGSNCLVPTGPGPFAANCTNLLDPSNVSTGFPLAALATQPQWESPLIPVARLFNALASPGCGSTGTCDRPESCQTPPSSQDIFFWAQTSSNALPDSTELVFTLNLNGQVQLAPTVSTVEDANQALAVTWTWPSQPSSDPNLIGVQLFCQRGADQQVFSTGTFGASYVQSSMLCPNVTATVTQPAAFSNQSPTFLCSGLLPLETTSYRISGLQNGVEYGVGVAAVDKYGNLSAIAPSEILHGIPTAGMDGRQSEDGGASADGGTSADGGQVDDGGHGSGGSCALSGWQSGRGTFASLMIVGLGVLLVGRNRRRR